MRLNIIGFSRYITQEWLNDTARLTNELKDPEQVKEALHQTIDNHEGEEAKRKTIDVLTRIWARVDDEHIALRDEALELFKTVNSNEKLMLHWGLLIIAYPIFHDVTEIIGRLISLQGSVTINQVKRSIIKDWGDRTTLNRTIGRIFQSLVDWNLLRVIGTSYYLGKKIETSNFELQRWLITSLLEYKNPDSLTSEEVYSYPSLFPFNITIKIRQLSGSKAIEVLNQGSNIQILRLKR